jgi:hypothetical protein
MQLLAALLILFCTSPGWATIPAAPMMTLYRFNSGQDIPYYDLEIVRRTGGPSAPAGTLPQGTALIPCLAVIDGRPLTDNQGVPYVGFQVVVDPRSANPAAAEIYQRTLKERQSLQVANHHCEAGVRQVLDVRNLYPMAKAPFFDPPSPVKSAQDAPPATDELDRIIRAFHNSATCDSANRHLLGRRHGLQEAWNRFISDQLAKWPQAALQRAMHLDYTMRTAIFEGHLERGCNAYGACERNIIALSIRNRGREGCLRNQGCGTPGDFQGVSSKVSQYNIWDEYLTQISGLTSCFLRDDLAGKTSSNGQDYRRLQTMYVQSLPEVQRILFGSDQDLQAVFPNNALADLKRLKHYYHAPAMGKCFPQAERVAFIAGAVASKGGDFALLANTRIRVDQQAGGGSFFRQFVVQDEPTRDVIRIVDSYPGFIIDGRRVTLQEASSRCAPYGIPGGCRFNEIGRYRKTPTWVNQGKPLELTCRVADRGEQCHGGAVPKTVQVGGVCDTEMRPFAGVD